MEEFAADSVAARQERGYYEVSLVSFTVHMLISWIEFVVISDFKLLLFSVIIRN